MAITSTATGLLVYQTDGTDGFYFYNGTAWVSLSDATHVTDAITDADNDTKVQVEKTTDDDIIRFDVAGSESMVISNNGNVGVGESSPVNQLVLRKDDNSLTGNELVLKNRNSTASATGSRLVFQGYRDTNQNHEVASIEGHHQTGDLNDVVHGGALVFKTNTGDWPYNQQGFERMRITEDGNVGIGTSSPIVDLHVAGTTPISAVQDGVSSIVGMQAEGNSLKFGRLSGSDLSSLLYIQGDGNVGIGTSTPDTTLHIAGAIKIVDGSQGSGKVLVSDANGVTAWSDPNDGLSVPDTAQLIPIRYHGSYIYVHPTDNAISTNWATAQSTCSGLTAHGHSDWYLPNLNELNAMYKQSFLITGLEEVGTAKYWSNTELDGSNAYTQRLDYGGPDPDAKTDLNNCRCIRNN